MLVASVPGSQVLPAHIKTLFLAPSTCLQHHVYFPSSSFLLLSYTSLFISF